MAKMINCKACGNSIASSAKACPSCGAKNKKPIYKRWWVWLLAIIIVGGIAGGNSSTSSTSESSQVAKSKEKFEIIGDVEVESDMFATYLHGIIKNNKNKECTYVQVVFNLYDTDGNQVGTAIANTNYLAANGTWKFKAIGIDVDGQVASYKLAEIIGY